MYVQHPPRDQQPLDAKQDTDEVDQRRSIGLLLRRRLNGSAAQPRAACEGFGSRG
jgi:hypothetical protein